MKDRLTTLFEIQALAPTHLAQAATRWLSEDGIEETIDRPGEIEVAEAARLWRLRSHHVQQAGKHLVGAEEFLAELTALNPAKKLRQYSFHGAEHTGSVFFEKGTQKYVGLVIVESKPMQSAIGTEELATQSR